MNLNCKCRLFDGFCKTFFIYYRLSDGRGLYSFITQLIDANGTCVFFRSHKRYCIKKVDHLN